MTTNTINSLKLSSRKTTPIYDAQERSAACETTCEGRYGEKKFAGVVRFTITRAQDKGYMMQLGFYCMKPRKPFFWLPAVTTGILNRLREEFPEYFETVERELIETLETRSN